MRFAQIFFCETVLYFLSPFTVFLSHAKLLSFGNFSTEANFNFTISRTAALIALSSIKTIKSKITVDYYVCVLFQIYCWALKHLSLALKAVARFIPIAIQLTLASSP